MSLQILQPDTSSTESRKDLDFESTLHQVNSQTDESVDSVDLTIETLQQHIKQAALAFQQANDQPSVSPFPVEVFPAILQEVIDQTAHYLQFRPDWIGSAILYAASVALGNSVGTRYNGWAQKATLYMALVGTPGTNKSGPPEYAIRPLRGFNADVYRIYKQQLADYTRWLGLTKKERQAEGLPIVMIPPLYKTLLVSDVTPEALAQTHQANPLGLGLFMDELAGWFQNFNRYSKGSDQEFWLSIFSFSPISIIRKTSAPIQIDSPFISILGTIQPGVLSELAKDRRNQNGFIDRILFAYPDDQRKPYDSEGEPDRAVLNNYTTCINKLLMLRQAIELDDNGNPDTQWLPFSPDAFAAMKAWKKQNTDLSNQTENPALKGIYAKLEAYCIRFALVLELLDWACDQSDRSRIQLISVCRAIQLTEYYRQNAQKVYYVLNEQTAAERLPKAQQRLFNALPNEISTGEAIVIAKQLIPPISVRTAKSMLKDINLFQQVSYGRYTKRC